MPHHNGLTPAEREVETALAGLRPAAAGCDSAALMYRAGLAAGRRHVRIWQGAAVLLAVILSVSFLYRSAGSATPLLEDTREYAAGRGQPGPQPADVEFLQAPRSGRPVREAAYLKLRNRVLEYGLEMLPEVKAAAKAGGVTLKPENLGEILTNDSSLNGDN